MVNINYVEFHHLVFLREINRLLRSTVLTFFVNNQQHCWSLQILYLWSDLKKSVGLRCINWYYSLVDLSR
ncbi:hypothetical protein QJS04_geneDACA024000 [Acorus gramineus]|uniref:Uncharacterized protein n=1 Tax=Acorus gramineus TaxID=55184 RepID=A0AAV9BXP6_ACOGR|nr:hypothetical protein QJS04_geneDACA024000 [Acorus gramineus]